MSWLPMDIIILCKKSGTKIFYIYEPGILGLIDKCCLTTVAMRVAVSHIFHFPYHAFILQVSNDRLIGFPNFFPLPLPFCISPFIIAVLKQRQFFFFA